MTPEAVEEFRGFWQLDDLAICDDPEGVFTSMAAVAAWSFCQAGKPGAGHDAKLSSLGDHTGLWMGLLPHLATIDRHFFDLAKRMTARTLVRHTKPADIYLQMAAALLVSDPPKTSKPKAARDAVLVIGITVGLQLGWLPTESEKDGPMTRSCCGRMAEILRDIFNVSIEYDAIVKVWKNREAVLQAAGFEEKTVLDFLPPRSPMNSGPA